MGMTTKTVRRATETASLRTVDVLITSSLLRTFPKLNFSTRSWLLMHSGPSAGARAIRMTPLGVGATRVFSCRSSGSRNVHPSAWPGLRDRYGPPRPSRDDGSNTYVPPTHDERSPKETIAIHTDATPPFPKSAKYKVIECTPQYDGGNSCVPVNTFGRTRGTVLPGVLVLIIVIIPFSCVRTPDARTLPATSSTWNQSHQRPRTDRSWKRVRP